MGIIREEGSDWNGRCCCWFCWLSLPLLLLVFLPRRWSKLGRLSILSTTLLLDEDDGLLFIGSTFGSLSAEVIQSIWRIWRQFRWRMGFQDQRKEHSTRELTDECLISIKNGLLWYLIGDHWMGPIYQVVIFWDEMQSVTIPAQNYSGQ